MGCAPACPLRAGCFPTAPERGWSHADTRPTQGGHPHHVVRLSRLQRHQPGTDAGTAGPPFLRPVHGVRLGRGLADLTSYAEDVALITAVEVAQLHLLEEFFGIAVGEAKLAFGYSPGEAAALKGAGVCEMRHLLRVPLTLAKDAVRPRQTRCALQTSVKVILRLFRGPALPPIEHRSHASENPVWHDANALGTDARLARIRSGLGFLLDQVAPSAFTAREGTAQRRAAYEASKRLMRVGVTHASRFCVTRPSASSLSRPSTPLR